ncbi:MAG: hypothetical protein M3178_12170 [Pseudomonadota bacterium]|nr:hypothetical protein [Pseudomonadota bacterium]
MTLSARFARTPADLAEAVRERLGARARAHATRPAERGRETRPGHDLARSRPNDLRSLRRSGAHQKATGSSSSPGLVCRSAGTPSRALLLLCTSSRRTRPSTGLYRLLEATSTSTGP